MRGLLAIFAALMLSGCWWIGPAFYQPDPSNAGPFEPGLYKFDILGDHKPAQRMRVARAPDGTILFKDPTRQKNESDEAVFARLTVPGRSIWIVQWRSGGSKELGRAYGLVERIGNIVSLNAPLPCQGNEALVRAAGGTVASEDHADSEGNPVGSATGPDCGFSDKASLEKALLAYIAAHPKFGARARIKRIGD